jgi:hypothetical protein
MNPWNAQVVDNTSRHQICTVLQSAPPVSTATTSDQVCNPPDASFPVPPPPSSTDSGVVPVAPDAASPREAGAGGRDASADGAPNLDSGSSRRDAGKLDAALGDGTTP